MTRAELKQLAQIRLREAGALLKTRNYDGAYYLCGYVVECALKACIARNIRPYRLPERRFSERIYTHDLRALVIVAELEAALEAETRADPEFAQHWGTVILWTESSRYERHDKQEAIALHKAVSDPVHGVLQCLRRHW